MAERQWIWDQSKVTKQLVWEHSVDNLEGDKDGEFDRIERGIFAGFHAIGRDDMPLTIKDRFDDTSITRSWESDWIEMGADEEIKFLAAFEAARGR